MATIIILLQETMSGGNFLTDNWLVSIIMKGGPMIMVPLFIFSIITLGIFIERIYKFYTIPSDNKANSFLGEVEELIKKHGDIEKVIEFLKKQKTIFTFIFLNIIMRYKFLVEEKRPILNMREELLETAEDSVREYLEEFLPIINTIASVAVLLGLLGTVLGMISSFDEIAKGGKGDPTVVAGGISVALITTASGLIVALPAILAYSFLRRRLEKIIVRISPFANHFINYVLKDLARLSTYKAMLLTAFRDGVLNAEEQKFLKEKRIELNISEKEFEKLSEEILSEINVKVDLDKAEK